MKTLAGGMFDNDIAYAVGSKYNLKLEDIQNSDSCRVTQEILRQSRSNSIRRPHRGRLLQAPSRATVVMLGLSLVVNPSPLFFSSFLDLSKVWRLQAWLVGPLRSSSSGSSYSSSSGAVTRTETRVLNRSTNTTRNLSTLGSRRWPHPRPT